MCTSPNRLPIYCDVSISMITLFFTLNLDQTLFSPLLSPSSWCGSGWEKKKKTFMLIGFDNTQRSRTEGSPIPKYNQRVESIILCPRGKRGWWGMCFWRCAKGRRVGTRGAVGRTPTGGPQLRRLEPSSPSILISSDLPLPCFTPLPTVLIWPAPRRAAGAAKARFHLQLSDGLPVCLTAKLTERCNNLNTRDLLCKVYPFRPAVTNVCSNMQSSILLLLIVQYGYFKDNSSIVTTFVKMCSEQPERTVPWFNMFNLAIPVW